MRLNPRRRRDRQDHQGRQGVRSETAPAASHRLGPPASQQRLPLGAGRALMIHRRALVVTGLLVLAALAETEVVPGEVSGTE